MSEEIKYPGLTQAEVAQRQRQGLTNQPPEPQFKSDRQIIKDNTLTYFNLIFLILAILLVIVGSYVNLTFLPVIIANTIIGIIQEIRSKRALEKLTVLHASKVQVVRNSQINEIATDQLVLDDVFILKTGMQIPVDGVLLAGALQVNEALLTGEADEIPKNIDDQVMSGSFVVAGQAYVKATAVGEQAYVNQLTTSAKQVQMDEESVMIKSLNRLIKAVGITLIPLGLALFYRSFVTNGLSFQRSIVAMEAALIGMIPEGLFLLATVALAISAVRLSRQQVLLHSMKSIETLARVTVICVDKTGTITENEMVVDGVTPTVNATRSSIQGVLNDFVQAMPNDNSTMQALHQYFTSPSQKQATNLIPFGSAWKFFSVAFDQRSYVLGAPEMVLRDDFDRYHADFAADTQQGVRILVFGKYEGPALNDHVLSAPVTPLAYVRLVNPVRASAPDTFVFFARQGVKIKVISGDNPETVSAVAQRARIENADQWVNASQLTSDNLTSALQTKTVFGRVTPEQKQQFVEELQAQGEVVAMTGDGVNDILAMKQADTSIAMATGSDATMQAAQMVLLDSDFAKMPAIVNEGRRVVNNIERSASLFLVKNIFSFLLALFTLIFAFNYPLQPSQITLISLFTIGVPSFLLALEANHERISGRFMTNIFTRALPGGVTDAAIVAIIVVCGSLFALTNNEIQTASTLILAGVGFMVLYYMSRPLNGFRLAIFVGCLLGAVIGLTFFKTFFGIKVIDGVAISFAIVLLLSANTVLRYLTKLVDWLLQPHSFKKRGDK